MKTIFALLSILGVTLFYGSSMLAQSLEVSWKTKTDGKIVAGPIADKNRIYVGNEKGQFVALDPDSGVILWQYESGGNIQAKAVLHNDLVIFESANKFYALNSSNGEVMWKYDLEMEPEKFTYADVDYLYKLDPFDDKRSSGVVHDEIFYAGTSNGKVIGLNMETGELEFSISTRGNSPVRSTPLIEEGKMLFGDWNGMVYCFDLKERMVTWQKKTYRDKLYETFGGIVSEIVIHKSKVFFGARNHMLNVLWLEDGQKEWTYTDVDGGWLIGDPVIYNDTLYIGGSDNFSMMAFDSDNGKLLWKNRRSKNIYVKPIVTKEWVIYAGGNSYNPRDKGEIVVLNRKSGKEVTTFVVDSNVFSSPVYSGNQNIVFGSHDGTIYSLHLN